MKKKYLIVAIVVIFLCVFLIKGFVQRTGDVPDKSVRPVAKGTPYSAQELEFYLPSNIVRNPSSSNHVYEYYSGEMKHSGPTGISVSIIISELTDDPTFVQYLDSFSYGSKDKVTYDTKNINDYKWWFAEDDNHQYYCSEFNGKIYDVLIYKNKEKDSVYKELVKMFKKTLFFEHLEEK